MKDPLAGARSTLAERLLPYADSEALAEAGLTLDGLVQDATTALVSTLSRDFVLTPRKPLLAVINANNDVESAAEDVETQLVLLEMALATSRIR